jgi:hypothetical protein
MQNFVRKPLRNNLLVIERTNDDVGMNVVEAGCEAVWNAQNPVLVLTL